MNPILVCLVAGLAGLGVIGYTSIHKHQQKSERSQHISDIRSYEACQQRNQGRVTVRHIIHRQQVGYAKIKDLANEGKLRKEITADLARVQRIDCGPQP